VLAQQLATLGRDLLGELVQTALVLPSASQELPHRPLG
jgi:hypothetical protein